MRLFSGILCLLLVATTPVIGSSPRISRSAEDVDPQPPPSTEEGAKKWVDEYNKEAAVAFNLAVTGSWNYDTNLTEENKKEMMNTSAARAKFLNEKAVEAKAINVTGFEDKSLVRELEMISEVGDAILEDGDYKELTKLNAELVDIYSKATVCKKPDDVDPTKCYPLDPDLTKVMSSSNDLKELEWAWKGWRDAAGKPQAPLYEKFTTLQNKAAKLNGYKDNGDYWRSAYESATFREDCEELYNKIKPFYQELHAYVRMKLRQQYKGLKFAEQGHIPAHILGNMWGQSWENVEKFVKPDPAKPDLDITEKLIEQNYTVLKIFETSEKFFTSLGLPKMTQEFWDNSMMEKPKDRDVVCHASAWDFFDGKDFRIKQCTEVDHKWFLTTHHEMGHIAYYEQYKGQPIQFRTGANPGFHEAQADIASLSVATPAYLKQIGLFPTAAREDKTDLNFLMQQALTKIAFLPFGYMIDQWRWSVYDGNVTRKDYNKKWWENRCKYQGLSPPVERSDDDFDAGAKFHIPNSTPYIRYFVAHIIQYQFHEALCKEAGNLQPLHECSIHNSTKAGAKLKKMLEMGGSRPWPEAMKEITGTEKMSAEPLLKYFKPLIEWLKVQNKKGGEKVGWSDECPPHARGNAVVKVPAMGVVMMMGVMMVVKMVAGLV